MGRRSFVGLARGWLADRDSEPTAEDIAEHLEGVAAAEPFTIPTSIFDEVTDVCTQLGL